MAYNGLKLHLPKQFCELPRMPFPNDFPIYPSREQFIESWSRMQGESNSVPASKCVFRPRNMMRPVGCGELVVLRPITSKGLDMPEAEYICRWLRVATGENTVPVIPHITGKRCSLRREKGACPWMRQQWDRSQPRSC